VREQNKVALAKEKVVFGSEESKIARADDVRRMCFALAFDIVKKDVTEMQNKKYNGSLYQALFALADRKGVKERSFKWFGNLKTTAISKSIKTIIETLLHIQKIVEEIEPRSKFARLDLLADVVSLERLPEASEAIGDDIVKCEILGSPMRRLNTVNLETVHQDGHKGQLRICSKLFEGATSIVAIASFPAGLITIGNERFDKKINGKSRGKTAVDNIVRGKSTLADGVKKLLDDPTTSAFTARAVLYVFNTAKNLFQIVGRFEAARKLATVNCLDCQQPWPPSMATLRILLT
jgi:hypothetical protein